jgi:transposase
VQAYWSDLHWDHRSAHKVTEVEALLTARGVRRIRLSPDAPDFNPIEQCWSKINTWLCQAKAWTAEVLIDTIKDVLDALPSLSLLFFGLNSPERS